MYFQASCLSSIWLSKLIPALLKSSLVLPHTKQLFFLSDAKIMIKPTPLVLAVSQLRECVDNNTKDDVQ